jgi:hypothetical protein
MPRFRSWDEMSVSASNSSWLRWSLELPRKLGQDIGYSASAWMVSMSRIGCWSTPRYTRTRRGNSRALSNNGVGSKEGASDARCIGRGRAAVG